MRRRSLRIPDTSPVAANRADPYRDRSDAAASGATRPRRTVASRSWPSVRRSGSALAGRVAMHAGGHLPHGDALAALGRASVALGGPWLAAAWTIGALAGSRAPRSARRRRGARAGHRGLVPAHRGRGRSRGRGLRGARRRRLGRRRARPRARSSAWRARAGATAAAARARRGRRHARRRPGRRGAAARGPVGGPRRGGGAGRRARRRASGCWPPLAAGRRSLLTLAVFAVAAVAFAGIEDGVRDTLRLAGWAGP